jgi:regulator of replication initiation timing
VEAVQHIYFDVVSNKVEDISVLHNKIDNLEYQILVKDTDMKSATEENHALSSHNKELRLVKNAACIYTTDVEETNL